LNKKVKISQGLFKDFFRAKCFLDLIFTLVNNRPAIMLKIRANKLLIIDKNFLNDMSKVKKINVVISDSSFEDAEIEKQILRKIGAEIRFFQCESESEIIEVAKDADALLNDHLPLRKKTLSRLNSVRIIVRYGVGYDNIDLKTATEKRIIVCNVPDYCTNEVAEHTLSLILALVRKILWMDASTRNGEWDWKKFVPIYRLSGRTVGIIGFGKIGQAVAERLKPFGLKIIAHDPIIPREVFENRNVTQVKLDELLSTADIILIHCPLTKDTYHMINREKIELMKRTAILINVSRGAIVDEKALYLALKEKRIQAAGLDTFEFEPVKKQNPLLTLDNVIVTPHVAWYSEEAAIDVRRTAAEEVLRFFYGIKPKNVVNPDVLRYYPNLKVKP